MSSDIRDVYKRQEHLRAPRGGRAHAGLHVRHVHLRRAGAADLYAHHPVSYTHLALDAFHFGAGGEAEQRVVEVRAQPDGADAGIVAQLLEQMETVFVLSLIHI